jgi:hypothetical protein
MSNSLNNPNSSTELKIVNAKLEALDLVESKYHNDSNWMNTALFSTILAVEVLSTCMLIHKNSDGTEIDKWLKAIGGSALPVVITVASSYFVADKYGIKQEQQKISDRYKSMLESNPPPK